MSADYEHGTYAGYMQCRKAPDGPCRACRDAATAYVREWRGKNPENAAAARAQVSLRRRAMTILAGRHRRELQEIIAQLRSGSLERDL